MAKEPTFEELKRISEEGSPEELERDLKKVVTPESEEVARLGITPTGGRRFGMAPGLKDPDALRAAVRQRGPVLRGTSPDEGNPTPPAEVGTGHIGLGPTEEERGRDEKPE